MAVIINATILDPSGQPLFGARVIAALSGAALSAGVVVPMVVEAETGALGTCSLSLWPNTSGTSYEIRIQHAMLRPSLAWSGVTVPNVESLRWSSCLVARRQSSGLGMTL